MKRLVEYLIQHCELKPIIQYSNEDWNIQFEQTAYILETIPPQNVNKWTFHGNIDVPMATAAFVAKQTAGIKQFAGNGAYVALCGQFRNPKLTKHLLECVAFLGGKFDLFAVAPYVGNEERAYTLEQAGNLERRAFSEISYFETVTKQHIDHLGGVAPLVAYECGLSYRPRNDTTATAFANEQRNFMEFNRTQGAGKITYDLLASSARSGFEMMLPYSFATTYQQWDGQPGSHFFGHCEIRQGQSIIELPKYYSARQGLQDFQLMDVPLRLN